MSRADLTRRGFLGLTAGAAASGCGINLGGGSGDLVVASFYSVDKDSGWDGMVGSFEQKHGIKVQAQVPGGSTDYVAKILAQKASGTMPDVLGVENSTMFPYFQARDVLEDLTPWLDKDKSFQRSGFYPKIIDRYTVDGRVYGIPYDAQPVCGVLINKDLFRAAGFDPPSADWTWASMIELARQLTKDGDGETQQYGLDAGGNWRNWIFAYGGREVDDVNRPTAVLYDSDAAIRGMQAYVDLIDDGVAPSPSGLSTAGLTSADLFVTGKVAMSVLGYWEVVFAPDKFAEVDLGYVMLPPGPAGGRVFQTGGTCYSISSSSGHKDLAFDFIRHFMGLAGWKAAAATGQPIYPPAYMPAYQQVFLAQRGAQWPIPNKHINGDATRYALFQPRDPAWNEISTKYIEPDVDLMEQGKRPVAETLADWSQRFTPMLTANNT